MTPEEILNLIPTQAMLVAKFEIAIEEALRAGAGKTFLACVHQSSYCDGDPCPEYTEAGFDSLGDHWYINDKIVLCDNLTEEEGKNIPVLSLAFQSVQKALSEKYVVKLLAEGNDRYAYNDAVVKYTLVNNQLHKSYLESPYRDY